MSYSFKYSLLLLIILIAGCNMEKKPDEITGQSDSVFDKGEKMLNK
ncbi:MAG: hypothetical protein K0B05_07075 [Bacteroidales bacterium]|nr:hypothetical protein [Bacteroidales bacterium]